MKYEYIKVSAAQRATIIAALRHLNGRPLSRVLDSVIDPHEIDKLIDELILMKPVDLEQTQRLDTPREATPQDHVKALYGEAVIGDLLGHALAGIPAKVSHEGIKPLAYACAALELMRHHIPTARTSKLTLERVMTTIYDTGECSIRKFHQQALDDAETALRRVTEKYPQRV